MSQTKYNLWKPGYVLEVEEIDSQHRVFFAYCANLLQLADESASKEHTNKELLSLFFKLRSYAFHHFMDEEAIMIRHNYPLMREHVRAHNRYFMDFFRAVEDEHNIYDLDPAARMDGKSRSIAVFLSDFAAGWLEEHIYDMDKRLARHIQETPQFAPK